MLVGRVLFGIGGDALGAAAKVYLSEWFQGKILSFSFAIMLTSGRLATYANFQSVGRIFRYFKEVMEYSGTDALGRTFIISCAITFISLIVSIILGLLDRRRALKVNQEIQKQKKIDLKDITKFSTRFWLISVIGMLYYVSVFSFTPIAQVFLEESFGFKPEESESLQGGPYIIAAVSMPLFGIVVDRYGRNIGFVTLACF